MSEESQPAPVPAAAPEVTDATATSAVEAPSATLESTPAVETKDTKVDESEPTAVLTVPKAEKEEVAAKPAEEVTEKPAEKSTKDTDVHMKDVEDPTHAPASEEPENDTKPQSTEATAPAPTEGMAPIATRNTPTKAEAPAPAPIEDVAPADTRNTVKAKAPARRKSGTVPEHKGKKLNKKSSKAQILHLDAKPGDQFFIKLKGYPLWPCIICDEDMLPQLLLKNRPVSAARPDGTYRDDFAEGSKKAADRSFPIMYLSTNEFGWVCNKDLVDLDPDTVESSITPKMRKDLALAHELAAQKNGLDFYKGVLQQFQDELIEKQRLAEDKAAATPKKAAKKDKIPKPSAKLDDEDVEMVDADDVEDEEPVKAKKGNNKRTAEESETPQRAASVKKPKIKLTNNSSMPKTTNGAATPKSTTEPKGAKTKSSKKTKQAKGDETEKEAHTPKEPELSPEERHQRKEKEVLFLRHKLQKGLLTRDQQPKEEEMEMMSGFVTKLEGFPDLEVSIIRATKINKVLKAILKLDSIPKEDEFNFKPRSQVLLDKWNKLLAEGDAPAASSSAAAANGVNGSAAEKDDIKAGVNGLKIDDAEPKADKAETKAEEKTGQAKAEAKENEKKEEPAIEEEKPAVEKSAKAKEAVEPVA